MNIKLFPPYYFFPIVPLSLFLVTSGDRENINPQDSAEFWFRYKADQWPHIIDMRPLIQRCRWIKRQAGLWIYFFLVALMVSFSFNLNADYINDQPFLQFETQMHTKSIKRMSVDSSGKYLATASTDKTVRIWDVKSARLLSVLRVPIGSGPEGQLYSVALSPNGSVVAASGWTGYAWDDMCAIYIFDRKTGQMVHRIGGLHNVVNHLTFSRDGHYLAASLGGKAGIRVFSTKTFSMVALDDQYEDSSNWVSFDLNNRLVASSFDGFIRLYDASFQLMAKKKPKGGDRPYGVTFSPDGTLIAVGFDDKSTVALLSGDTLAFKYTPATTHIRGGNLRVVAFSKRGRYLYGGGTYHRNGIYRIIVWDKAGHGKLKAFPCSLRPITGITPLEKKEILFSDQFPSMGLLAADGTLKWNYYRGVCDFEMNNNELWVSSDASLVEFSFNKRSLNPGNQKKRILFDLFKEQVTFDITKKDRVITIQNHLKRMGYHPGPRDGVFGESTRSAIRAFQQDRGLSINGQITQEVLSTFNEKILYMPKVSAPGISMTSWKNSEKPRLNGKRLPLEPYEISRSFSIAPDNRHFMLGTDHYLRYFNAKGVQQWKESLTSAAWSVNISRNGTLAVVALSDGSINWYDISDRGHKKITLLCQPGLKAWVSYMPLGFYNGNPEGEKLLGYHLNQGKEREAEFITSDQLGKFFYRPDLVTKHFLGGYENTIHTQLTKTGGIDHILSSGLAPKVVVSESHMVRSSPTLFVVDFTVENQGGGGSRVEFWLDDINIGSKSLLKPKNFTMKKSKLSLKHSLTVGKDHGNLSIFALNQLGTISSKPASIQIKFDRKQREKPSLYGVFVGISAYGDQRLNLRHAKSDAETFASAMENQGKEGFGKVSNFIFTDERATVSAIKSVFEDLRSVMTPDDVLVWYLSGAGMAVDGDFYFIPHEGDLKNIERVKKSALSNDQILQLLRKIPSLNRFLIMDISTTGELSIKGMEKTFRKDQDLKLAERTAMTRLARETGHAVLGGISHKKFQEQGFKGNSLFTYALIKGMTSGAKVTKENGVILSHALTDYVKEAVPWLSSKNIGPNYVPVCYTTGKSFVIGYRKK